MLKIWKHVYVCTKNPKVFGAIDGQSCLAPFYLSFFFGQKVIYSVWELFVSIGSGNQK